MNLHPHISQLSPKYGPPPQPRNFKVEQPKPVVPDVTLMFDSNDSLLWRVQAQPPKPNGSHKNVYIEEKNIEYISMENNPIIDTAFNNKLIQNEDNAYQEKYRKEIERLKSLPNQVERMNIDYNPHVYKSKNNNSLETSPINKIMPNNNNMTTKSISLQNNPFNNFWPQTNPLINKQQNNPLINKPFSPQNNAFVNKPFSPQNNPLINEPISLKNNPLINEPFTSQNNPLIKEPFLSQTNPLTSDNGQQNLNKNGDSSNLEIYVSKSPQIYTTTNADDKINLNYHGYNMRHMQNSAEKNVFNKMDINNRDNLVNKPEQQCLKSKEFRNEDRHETEISPKRKIDKHVLKVLEEQKLQIMCLHDILEKVLANQISNKDANQKLLEPCYKCYTDKSDIKNQKIAMVQTTFVDTKPQTNTIGINTDITMQDIDYLLENQQKYNEFIRKRDFIPKQNHNYSPDNRKTNKFTVDFNRMPQRQNEYLESPDKQDESLILPDIKTVHEGYSPDPTMRIDVPDYYEECPKENCDTVQCKENEVPEVAHEDSNRRAVYEEVMINIQHILQSKEKPNTPPKENNVCREKWPNMKNNNQIEEQLQNYGISFLDPSNFQDKRDLPINAMLMQGFPSMISMYQGTQRSKGLDKAMALQYQRTAYIPTNSHGLRVPGPRNYSRNLQHFINEETSIATGQFLGKFGLQE